MTRIDLLLKDLVKDEKITVGESIAIGAAVLHAADENETFRDRYGLFSQHHAKQLLVEK